MSRNPHILMMTSGNMRKMPDDFTKEVLRICPSARLHTVSDKDVPDAALLDEIEIVFGPIKPAYAARAPRLKWVQIHSAGCEAYTRHGSAFPLDTVRLTNASGVFDLPIAEHVCGMMLGHARGLFHFARQQTGGHWHSNHTVERDFSGSTVGIIGLGSIGTAVAVRSRALGAKVLGMRRHPSASDPVDASFTPDKLHEMLAQCDYVVLCLPSTAETAHLIDAAALAAMQKHAFIVNIGRGTAIDTDALVEALRAGTVGGAGLDVTDPEPLPDNHPLWGMDNVLITPHTSGGSPGDEGRIRTLFLDNLARYLDGQPLVNLVDPVAGY